MEEIDSSFDAYISFGHAGAGLTLGGVIDHCYNGGKIYNLRFNGVTMNTETVCNGLIAGFYGVPLIACIAVIRRWQKNAELSFQTSKPSL